MKQEEISKLRKRALACSLKQSMYRMLAEQNPEKSLHFQKLESKWMQKKYEAYSKLNIRIHQ